MSPHGYVQHGGHAPEPSRQATHRATVLLVTWFPQDSYGYPATTAGVVHIAVAGVAALPFVVAMISAGRAFRTDPQWAGLAGVSTLAAVAVVVTGLAGAIAAAAASPYMGLLQRLNIGRIMVWLAVVGWYSSRHGHGALPVVSDKPRP